MVDGIALDRTQVGTSSKAVGNQRTWVPGWSKAIPLGGCS